MADKKYYWLKLDKNFFKRHDIRIIEDMPNGKEYVLFFMKLLVESIDHEGRLRFNELIPYNDQMLATITNTNIDIVRSAIKMFQSLELLQIWDDKTIYINDTQKMLGTKTEWAVKKAEWRAKQIEYKDNEGQKKDIVRQEKEIEKEIELDIDKEIKNKDIKPKKNVYGEFKNVKLTDDEYKKLEEKGLLNDIEKLSSYIESKGVRYKSHYATILVWNSKNKGSVKDKIVDIPNYYTQKDDEEDKDELLRKLKEM